MCSSDLAGTDSFTYTASDGTKTSTGTVTVTVVNSNDPPTAVNDKFVVRKNAAEQSLKVMQNDSDAPDSGETLTVVSVTTGSAGGKLAISSDKLSVLYQPVAEYLGEETFDYTIDDGNGGTATAKVTINVVDYIPSTISGKVFVDRNNDGIAQANEAPIGGVKITLVGTDSISNNPVQRETTTDEEGHYEFAMLAPGTYTIEETQPALINDGKETAGSAGGTVIANDKIQLTIAENTTATGYSFGERGRPARFLSLNDFTARITTSLFAASAVKNDPSQTLWTSNSPVSDDLTVTAIMPGPAGYDVHAMQGGGPNSVPVIATIPLNDPRVRVLAYDTSSKLLGLYGNPQSFNFQPVTSTNNTPNGEGESRMANPALFAAAAAPVTFVANVQAMPPADAMTSVPDDASQDGVIPVSMVSIPSASTLVDTNMADDSMGLKPNIVDAAFAANDVEMGTENSDEESALPDLEADHQHEHAVDEFFASW